MALLDEEWIKRILSGNFGSSDLAQSTGEVPVPAQRPIEAVTLGPQEAVTPAVVPAEPAQQGYQATGLLGLLPKSMQPESEASQQALARALLMGGASAMANPGQNWMSSIGQIVGTGTQAYDSSLAGQLATQEQQKKAQLEAEATQRREAVANVLEGFTPSQAGYSMKELQRLMAQAYRDKDDTTYRQIQGQIQKLQQDMATKGLTWDGEKFVPAAGVEESTNQMAQSEARAKKLGEESATRTENQRTVDRINEQRKAQGLPPITDQEFIDQGRETPDIKNWKHGAKDPEFRANQDMGKQKASTKITDSKGNEYPAPDKGYRYVDAGDGTLKLEMIPGGEADIKAKEAADKKDGRDSQKKVVTDTITNAIDDIIASDKSSYLGTTGLLGAATQYLPGSNSHDMSQNLSTIKANLTFDKLQEMRNNSPTGGALGSTTEGELKLLADSVAALDQTQSDAQFKRNLNRVYNLYNKAFYGEGNFEERPLDYGTEAYAEREKAKQFLKKSGEKPTEVPEGETLKPVDDADAANRVKYPKAPPVGTVMNGRRYKGGAVNDPANWVAQ